MHELSIAAAMVEQLEQAAAAEHATKIVRIAMELGAMSGVDRDAFEFVFPIASEGTLCEGAELHFDEVPVTVTCRACHQQSNPEFPLLLCMHCHNMDVHVDSGRDFLITSMEVL